MSFLDRDSCMTGADCPDLYYCYEYHCYHKNLYPLSFSEGIGLLAMNVLSSLAALAGMGGGPTQIIFMVAFFNYPQKIAYLLVFFPIVGAAIGNLSNLFQQKDPETNDSIVNMKIALLSCPMMALGSILGVIFNKFLPTFFLTSVVVFILAKQFLKYFKVAKTDFQTESKRIQQRDEQSQRLKEIELVEIDNRQSVSHLFKRDRNLKVKQAVLIFVFILLATLVTFYLIRGLKILVMIGSRIIKSLVGIQYCGPQFWMINILMMIVCFGFFEAALKLFLDVQHLTSLQVFRYGKPTLDSVDKIKHVVRQQSFLAGFMNAFGMGGGMFLIGMYKELGLSSIQATGTTSFNIFLTSLISAAQVLTLGIISYWQIFEIVFSMMVGTYVFSKFFFTILNKMDRLSIIMWCLTYFLLQSIILFPYHFFVDWGQKEYRIQEIFSFQEFC